MGQSTGIEWATHTWSPWRSCQHAELPDGTPHPGCLHCYAETMAKRNPTVMGVWGKDGTRVLASAKSWAQVRKWHDEAGTVRPRIFPSVCDPFEEWSGEVHDHTGCAHYTKDIAPFDFVTNEQIRGCDSDGYHYTKLDDVRRALFELIDQTPNLDWTLLTKRPQNIRKLIPNLSHHACDTGDCPHWNASDCDTNRQYRENVWLLYSASDQASYDAGLDSMLKCHGLTPVLGICCGPLTGPIDLNLFGTISKDIAPNYALVRSRINWVIVEGESGGGSRPCHIQWIRDIVRQCREADVPCFIKQLGACPVIDYYTDEDDLREQCLADNGRVLEPVRGGYSEWNWKQDKYQPRPGTVLEMKLRDNKGGDMSEWPEDLRVREFPKVGASCRS